MKSLDKACSIHQLVQLDLASEEGEPNDAICPPAISSFLHTMNKGTLRDLLDVCLRVINVPETTLSKQLTVNAGIDESLDSLREGT
jgi:hypothetical protein